MNGKCMFGDLELICAFASSKPMPAFAKTEKRKGNKSQRGNETSVKADTIDTSSFVWGKGRGKGILRERGRGRG